MKALTLMQPWATLVAVGAKRFETRSWRTAYTGPLAIHAGLGCDYFALETLGMSRLLPDEAREALSPRARPFGAFVAIVELEGCYSTDEPLGTLTELERLVGNFGPKRWAWDLRGVRPIKPFCHRGRQGLWNVTPHIERTLLERVGR